MHPLQCFFLVYTYVNVDVERPSSEGGIAENDAHVCGYLELDNVRRCVEKVLDWSLSEIKNFWKSPSELGAVVPQSQGLGQHPDLWFHKLMFWGNQPQKRRYAIRIRFEVIFWQWLLIWLTKKGILNLQTHFEPLNLAFWAKIGSIEPNIEPSRIFGAEAIQTWIERS